MEQGSKSYSIVSRGKAIFFTWLVVFCSILSLPFLFPAVANASFLSSLSGFFIGNSPQSTDASVDNGTNSQNIPLLQSSVNFDTLAAVGNGDIMTAGQDALMSENGPSGTQANISTSTVDTGTISSYMVQKGDTLSGIAKMFGVSVNTIIWANDVSEKTLKPGQILVILPVSGIIHTVAKGDTIASIAKKYKADANEIREFNGLSSTVALKIGDTVIIPNGEGSVKISSASTANAIDYKGKIISEPYRGGSGPDYPGYYIRPLVGGVKTQGLHGYNAVDIGTHVGTPLLAAASGQVIIARSSGWNGGYGDYVVISHFNGTQTLYGHMSQVYVSEGQNVAQGQVIGLSGNTGLSTGPHVHFEVRGAVNPFGP